MLVKYSKDKKVMFTEEDHKYVSTDTRERLISVTTLIHKYQTPFDPTGSITKNYAYKNNMTVEEVIEKWRIINVTSTDYGSAVHLELEHYILTGEIRESEYSWVVKLFAAIEFKGKLHAEVLIHSILHMVAGQVDVVEDLGNKEINIWDFKGLALDTPIPTHEGFKNIGDIQVGDKIYDGDGKITKVTNVSETHHNPCYKLTFDTNDTLVCDHEHRWVISNRKATGVYRTPKYKVFHEDEEITTDDMFQMYSSNRPVKIKCSPNLETFEKVLPIDPYILGVWLGAGANACGMITNMNPKLWNEIEKRGYLLGKDVSQGCAGLAQSRTIFTLYRKLKDNNLLHNKHIPDIYLRASFQQRLDLLRGIMDSDGHFNKGRKRCVLITTYEPFANALMDLVATLGLKPSFCKAQTFCTNEGCDRTKKIDTFHVNFYPENVNPFLSRNKDILDNSKLKSTVKSKFRYIKKIEKIDTVPTKCLTVDSPTHTYLAGRTNIKTHNTNKKLEKTNNWGNKLLRHLWFLDDCNFNIYTLQLSLYAYLMELKGLKINKLVILYINKETKTMDQHVVKYRKKEVMEMLENILKAA